MKSVAFIPVRIGSKGIPRKNIVELSGKPLLYWCLKALDESNVDEIIVYFDDIDIMNAMRFYTFQKVLYLKRSAESATDEATTELAMIEFLTKHPEYQDRVFLLIQATNPWIVSDDINKVLRIDKDVVSATLVKRLYWDDNTPLYDLSDRPRRQILNGKHEENGAIYKSTGKKIIESGCRVSPPFQVYCMPEYTGLEIDEPLDLKLAQYLCDIFQAPPPDLRGTL